MSISSLAHKAQEMVGDHSTAILTAVGVVGTVTTAVLTGRAAFKASQIIDAKRKWDVWYRGPESALEVDDRIDLPSELSTKEKAELTWKLYIPAVGAGATTIGAIIFANRIGAKRTVAMAAAYGLSDRKFSEYKEKVKEKLGDTKETKIVDEIAQDRVNNKPPERVVIIGSGDVLCFDASTGRYFMCTHEKIQKAQNEVNREIINHSTCSLSTFYDMIGLPPTRYSNDVGWNMNHHLEIVHSLTMSPDDRPCLVIDFSVEPIRDYDKLY